MACKLRSAVLASPVGRCLMKNCGDDDDDDDNSSMQLELQACLSGEKDLRDMGTLRSNVSTEGSLMSNLFG